MNPVSSLVGSAKTTGVSLWLSGIYAGCAALVANLIILYFAKPTAPAFMTLSVAPVSAWTLLGTVGATCVFAYLRKKTAQPNKFFIVTSLVVLLISFTPDVMLFGTTSPFFKGVTTTAIWVLMLMHVVAALMIVAALIRFTRCKKS